MQSRQDVKLTDQLERELIARELSGSFRHNNDRDTSFAGVWNTVHGLVARLQLVARKANIAYVNG
jgi:DICT domain-containing protein